MRKQLSLKVSIVVAIATIGLCTGSVSAQSPNIGAERVAASGFLGTWELDLSRMPTTYGPPPKRVVYTFADIGSGQWRTTVDITAPDDSVRHMAVSYRLDGTMVRSEADTSEADSAAILTPTPGVLVMNLARAKMLGSVRVYTLSPDARIMTESAAAVNAQGEPFIRNFYFKRIG